jgi:alkylhydroperoxidase/carboxymuconolactone decarboxylase family protein YurZ
LSVPGDATGFDTSLDTSSLDVISPNEADQLYEWYAQTHGEGNLDLTRFVPFMIEQCPGAFKRYRRYMETVRSGKDGLPLFAVSLLFLYTYVVLADERAIFYEVIASHEWGATKRDVIDTIQLAFLEGGPVGANAVAELSEDYLRNWDEAGEAPQGGWPEGWRRATLGTYRSGLDFGTDELSAAEHEALLEWYKRRGEDEPDYVRFLSRHRPEALKTLRSRYEHALGEAQLPEQMLPLFRLHAGSVQRRKDTVRAAAVHARRVGVTKGQLLEALCWSFLYANEEALNAMVQALDSILDDWPRQ